VASPAIPTDATMAPASTHVAWSLPGRGRHGGERPIPCHIAARPVALTWAVLPTRYRVEVTHSLPHLPGGMEFKEHQAPPDLNPFYQPCALLAVRRSAAARCRP
jgi:hypothetical protein